MRYLIALILLISTFKSLACDCADVPLIFEAYNSDAVFDGIAVSKIYSKDSSYYTVSFEVQKHYKNLIYPFKRIEVQMVSEWEYSGVMTSCDWHINEGERWLVLGDFFKGGFRFDGYCGNSRSLKYSGPSEPLKQILDRLNEFCLSDYKFSDSQYGFSMLEPKINIDSLSMSFGPLNSCGTQRLIFDIDKKGRLVAVNFQSQNWQESLLTDSIFKIHSYRNIEHAPPKNEFEKKALEYARLINKWQPLEHRKTKEKVNSQAYSLIYCDAKGYLKLGRFQ